MSRRFADDEDDDFDEDYPDEDAEDPTAPCPRCGADIYDDTERCPACGQYLTREEVRGRQPLWFIVAAVICLIVALFWAFGSVLGL